MRRLGRYLFIGMVLLSLLLALTTAVLWVRSYRGEPTSLPRQAPADWFGARAVHTARDGAGSAFYSADIYEWIIVSERGTLVFHHNHLIHSMLVRDQIEHLRGILPEGFQFVWRPANPLIDSISVSRSLVPNYFGNIVDRSGSVRHWAVLAMTLILPALWLGRLLYRRSRLGEGLCPKCGYDLRATPDRCPECGYELSAQRV